MIDSETVLNTGVLKISASRDVLAERLSLVARGVSTRTAVLVLAGIQLRAAEGQLHVGSVGALPANDVTLEYHTDESMLLITSGTASYRVHTYSAEDFPRLPE